MNEERWLDTLIMCVEHGGNHQMDWRHVKMVNAVLESEHPGSVVEIGCFLGYSTAAIIEAHEKKPFAQVDLVDTDIRGNLRKICPPDFNLMECMSKSYKGTPECWIIDGDHYEHAMGDYDRARAAAARIIIIHDSNAKRHPNLGFNQGAMQIGDKCRDEAMLAWEDMKERKGEETHRGLLVGFFHYQPKPETIARLKELSK